jgi:hypothetical protein
MQTTLQCGGQCLAFLHIFRLLVSKYNTKSKGIENIQTAVYSWRVFSQKTGHQSSFLDDPEVLK